MLWLFFSINLLDYLFMDFLKIFFFMIFNGLIKDLRFKFCLYQKPIGLMIKSYHQEQML